MIPLLVAREYAVSYNLNEAVAVGKQLKC